ncbi:class I SAM-dependent methyltransferase [Campylobacter lari]|nr:class I SAM-dependent methyltransferase [Campylobacter lari]MPB45374.1 class I SAM-dependent methyltransferase [Campylobacter lari]
MITDEKYWTDFYQSHRDPFAASLFAKFCYKHYIKKYDLLLELGCGNGRDSIFFSKNSIRVDAIDLCKKEIYYLNQKHKGDNVRFICMDFSEIDFVDKYDIVYSRFTLHSISEEQENRLFPAVYKALKKYKDYNITLKDTKAEQKNFRNIQRQENKEGRYGKFQEEKYRSEENQQNKIKTGYFCIEARGIKNSLYGLGKQVDKDSFIYNDHFRRFINIDITCKKLQSVGFDIVLAEENINFAPFKKENDYFVRIVAKK